MTKTKYNIAVNIFMLLIALPSYLIGVLLHIIGSAFKTFGYLFQLDINSAAEIWIDMYDDVINFKYKK